MATHAELTQFVGAGVNSFLLNLPPVQMAGPVNDLTTGVQLTIQSPWILNHEACQGDRPPVLQGQAFPQDL